MKKTTDTDLLLAGRKYDITASRMGDASYQRRLDRKWLLFPPTFSYAADPSNYHYENKLPASTTIVDGMAMLYYAEKYLNYWPINKGSCTSFIGTWKGAPFYIPAEITKGALQDYAISAITLNTLLGGGRSEDYTLFRYWFGLRQVKDGKIQYYPSITEIFTYGITQLKQVESADGSKQGKITDLFNSQDNPISSYNDAVVSVNVDWDDGSSTTEPYAAIVHLTPARERMSCRMQDVLSKYKSGLNVIEEKDYSDIAEKMAAMMVYVAFAVNADSRANESDIVETIGVAASKTQQEANMSFKYKTYKEIDVTSGDVIGYGWANTTGTNSGINQLQLMWDFVRGKGMKRVAEWGVFPAAFLDDVEHYTLGETIDTGLAVCPYCRNCSLIENVDFIDFGVYFEADGNPLTSVKYKVKENHGNYLFRAIGLVQCGCGETYYRKFRPIMRSLKEQMPIGNELSLRKPYTTQWVIQVSGFGARMGEVRGYQFHEHTIGELPSIRFFLHYAGNTMAVDYPLEGGALSRSSMRDVLCTGASIVPTTTMKSHTYYDNNYAPDEVDPYGGPNISQKGKGAYRGPNEDAWLSRTDALTGLKICEYCDKVGVPTTLAEGKAFMGGAREHLNIDRGDGSTVFDRPDIDIFELNNRNYYKLRLASPIGSRIRYLDVWADSVGAPIGVAPPLIDAKLKGNICPNDKWVQDYFALIEEYAVALAAHRNLDSKFLVCEGLAWSARYDTTSREWIYSRPKDDSVWMNYSLAYPNGQVLEIDDTTWEDKKNKPNELGGGTQGERFPAPKCGGDVSYKSAFASCMNSQQISTTHHIEVANVEDEIVEVGGSEVTKRITHLWCRTCEESYKGAADMTAAMAFIVGQSTDPTNVPTQTGANGEYSLFNEDYKWYFTHLLYPPHNKSLSDIASDREYTVRLRRVLPNNIFKWLKDGKSFGGGASTGEVTVE